MTRPRDLSTTTTSAAVDDYAVLDGATNGLRKILATNLPGGVGGGAVDSVFGRTGPVSAAASDYDANQVDFTPAGSIAATDVQAAIEELDTEKQPVDAALTAFAGLTIAADTLPYGNGTDTFATTAFTAAGRALAGGANAAAQQASLSLVPGTHVQAYDADLDWVAGLSGTGFLSRTAATPTGTVRTLTAGTGISITNPAGVAGDPTFSLATKRVIAEGLTFTPAQTLGATPSVITEASTPALSKLTWTFDNTTQWYLAVTGRLNGALPASTGCKLKFAYATTATSGVVGWVAALKKDSGVVLTTSFNYATNAQVSSPTVPGVASTEQAVEIAFTTGTQMNSLAAGDRFTLLISRDTAVGSNAAAVAQLIQSSVLLEEA